MKMSYIANLEMSLKKALKLGFLQHFNHVCHAGLSSIFFTIPNKSEGFPTSGNDIIIETQHKSGHFHFGENRTFSFWLDTHPPIS
jgi:hypothetical protein